MPDNLPNGRDGFLHFQFHHQLRKKIILNHLNKFVTLKEILRAITMYISRFLPYLCNKLRYKSSKILAILIKI